MPLPGLLFALAYYLVQATGQLRLDRQCADQDQDEGTQQHRHQVGEAGPDRGRGLAVVELHAHAVPFPATATAGVPSWPSSATICCCDIRLSSITSRAWAT